MSIRKKLMTTMAASALALGGLSVTSPAMAASSWGPIFDNQDLCRHETVKKKSELISRIKSGEITSVKVRYTCKHVDGYYISYLEWKTR